MRSKLRVALALAAAVLLSSCSLKINEQLQQSKISVNPAKEGCLANAGDTLDRYFAGHLEAAELESFWNCSEKAFQMFAQNTKGLNDGYYTPGELSAFLSHYFLKGREIDPTLMTEVMALKTGLLGGPTDRITRNEIQQILILFRVFHAESMILRPHMPITGANFAAKHYSPEQFEEALKTFEASMARMGQALQVAQGSYSLDRMADLLRAVKAFVYADRPQDFTWVDSALRWTNALRPAKAIFVAPPRDEIRASDWAKIYELAPRYYGLYLKASFYLSAESGYSYGPGLRRLESLFTDFNSLMGLVLSHHPNGVVQASEVDELLVALDAARMLPVRLDTARTFARALFGRVFSGGNPVQDDYTISKATFDRLREAFLFGTEGLRALEGVYRERLGDHFADSPLARRDLEALNPETLLKFTAEKSDVSREALASLARSAREVRTVFPNASATVFIPAGEEREKLSLPHLDKIHLFRTVNRLLVQAYAAKGSESLTENQIGAFVNDVFPFLEDLNVVDDSTKSSIKDRLLEASLFLYSSDGDRNLSMTEAIELESLLLSTVLRASVLHDSLGQLCPANGVDARGRALIPAVCYREQFLAHAGANWAYIPGLASFVEGLPKAEQKALFARMERFLRKGKGDAAFTLGDTQAFILLPYYVEMLFSRFDRDRNGVFDNGEAAAAYPVFAPFLKEKCLEHGLDSPEDFQAVFNFLLAYQELPTNMKATWLWRRFIAGNKSYRVDRGQVIQIFEKLLLSGDVK